MKITYKEIAEYSNKTEQAMHYWKKSNPIQLELTKYGALLKKYIPSINEEKLKDMVELENLIENSNITKEQLISLIQTMNSLKGS